MLHVIVNVFKANTRSTNRFPNKSYIIKILIIGVFSDLVFKYLII
jgi:hypothetical protein